MHPILFQIGDFPVYSFGVLIMTAFYVAIFHAGKRASQFGLDKIKVMDSAFLVILLGVLGARVMYIALNWSDYAGQPAKIFAFRMEGLTSFGGLLGGLVGLVLFCRYHKIPLLKYLDTVSVPVLFAHAIGRVGCLLNGCCYGFACSHWPPGVPQAGQPGLWHPAQAYDTVMTVAGALFVLALERRGLKPGASLGWMLIVYGISRFIYEFWRIGASSDRLGSIPLSLAQVAGLAMAFVGLILVARSSKMPNPQPA